MIIKTVEFDVMSSFFFFSLQSWIWVESHNPWLLIFFTLQLHSALNYHYLMLIVKIGVAVAVGAGAPLVEVLQDSTLFFLTRNL